MTETEIIYLGKLISDIFWAINRGYNPRHGISFGMTLYSVLDIFYVIISAITQRWKITKLKTKRTLTSMRNNSSSLYFNFISLPSPKAENWVSQLSPTVPLEKDATVNYEQQIH